MYWWVDFLTKKLWKNYSRLYCLQTTILVQLSRLHAKLVKLYLETIKIGKEFV